MAEATEIAEDIARLQAKHGPDGWFFTSCWVAAGSGPDRRMLIAQRAVVLSDFTAEALTAKIRHEEGRA